jgi:hypothetical protein
MLISSMSELVGCSFPTLSLHPRTSFIRHGTLSYGRNKAHTRTT